jgi:hypothetical protein
MDQKNFFCFPIKRFNQIKDINPAGTLVVVRVGAIPRIPFTNGAIEGGGIILVLGQVPDEFPGRVINLERVGPRKLRILYFYRNRPLGRLEDVMVHVKDIDIRDRSGRSKGNGGSKSDGGGQGDGG